jgi:polyhydroxybutyrate depolymerase
VPILALHGTDDYNVPFESARPAMADWALHNGCAADIVTEQISEHVSRESYSGCGANAVVLYVIEGGGHTWPGAEDDAPHGGAGPTTHEISASELIWSFFAAHARK